MTQLDINAQIKPFAQGSWMYSLTVQYRTEQYITSQYSRVQNTPQPCVMCILIPGWSSLQPPHNNNNRLHPRRPHSTLCVFTLYCTLYTVCVHPVLYTVYCACELCTVHYTLCIVCCTEYLYSLLYMIHCNVYTVNHTMYTLYYIQYQNTFQDPHQARVLPLPQG